MGCPSCGNRTTFSLDPPPGQTSHRLRRLAVYQLPNVFTMPHTAGSTDGTSRKRAQFAADNLDRYARGEALLAQVTTSFT